MLNIWLSLANLPLTSALHLFNDKNLNASYEVLMGLAGAVIGIMMALRLFDLSDPLYGMRRPLAIMWMTSGIGTIVYCTLGGTALVLGKPSGLLAPAVSLIFMLDVLVLIVVGIAEAIIQARLFYRAATQPADAPPAAFAADRP